MEKFNEQELRLLLVKESNYDLDRAEKMYNFIVGKQPKTVTKPVINEPKPDGIYFILNTNNVIHESLATDEDKHNSIAVGVKMGNKFANVALHNAAYGEKIPLCQENKVPCGSKQFFHDAFWKAISDWNGEANTNDIRNALNPNINLGKYKYIPSVAQLNLILLNINEINEALVEAGGNPMKEDWYWSSTENSSSTEWYVNFINNSTSICNKYNELVVRPAVTCKI